MLCSSQRAVLASGMLLIGHFIHDGEKTIPEQESVLQKLAKSQGVFHSLCYLDGADYSACGTNCRED